MDDAIAQLSGRVAALETENKLLVNGQKGSSFFFFEV
jgi:hypothetical protein